MNLTLVEQHRPRGQRVWFPFGDIDHANGFNRDWWHSFPVSPGSKHSYIRVLEDEVEVARLDIDPQVGADHYADVPPLDNALEIQFIEVHVDHRMRGLGREIVDLISEQNPGRRLVAFSEGADGFWANLGWSKHLHADPREAQRYRPLFVQPA